MYLGDKLFNKISLHLYIYYCLDSIARCLRIYLKLLTLLDIVAFDGILKLNNCNFRGSFAFSDYSLNKRVELFEISLEHLSRSTWCSFEFEREWPIMDFSLLSLLFHSINLFGSIGVGLVPSTIPHGFLFINCIWIFTFQVLKLKPNYLSNGISMLISSSSKNFYC